MKKTWKRILVALTVVILIGAGLVLNAIGAFLPKHKGDLNGFMESRLEVMEVPGMAAGIIGPDGVEWEGYYGTYDGEHPVTGDTLFMIASVSKTVIATAMMQLWEQDLFELDDDINDYLDFEVRNPNHPEDAITFKHLLTHRSTIMDRFPFYDEVYTIKDGGGDYPESLGVFLEAYLVPGGAYYDEANFLEETPGEKFDYSNYGAALAAHLVEVLSGEDFADYCEAHIFEPLGMEHSYFLLEDIPEEEIIASPFYEGVALPHYSYPDYPAGSLHTTINDLGRFAAYYLRKDDAEPVLLQPETIDLMFGEYGQSADMGEGEMGLLWTHMDWQFFNAVGHTGGDFGVSTYMLLYPEDEFATIVFLNGGPKSYLTYREVAARLREEGLQQ